jgi:hypothetical protein
VQRCAGAKPQNRKATTATERTGWHRAAAPGHRCGRGGRQGRCAGRRRPTDRIAASARTVPPVATAPPPWLPLLSLPNPGPHTALTHAHHMRIAECSTAAGSGLGPVTDGTPRARRGESSLDRWCATGGLPMPRRIFSAFHAFICERRQHKATN